MRLILFTSTLLLSGMVYAAKPYPRVQQGMIDLGQWNFNTDGIVELKGDWQFFWRQLISPDSIATADDYRYFPVPRVWNGKQHDDINLSRDSYATYRLVVKMPAGERILRLQIKDLPTAYRLWVNSQELIQFGIVGTSESTSIAAVGPREVTFNHKGEDLDIVLQVSSFFHIAGGTWHPLKIGLASDFEKRTLLEVSLDMLVLSCVVVMALYHFVIFWLRRENLSPLALAVFCTFIAVRVAISGDGQLALRFFNLDFARYRRLELLSFYSAVPSFLIFVQLIYPKIIPKTPVRLAAAACLPFIFIVGLFPSRVFTETIAYFQILSVVLVLMSVVIFVRAYFKKLDGSLIFMLGGLILSGAAFNDIMVARQLYHGANVIGFGLYIFIFIQSVAIAKIFSRAFDEVKANEKTIQILNHELEMHIENLDQIVEEKTREVRSIMSYIRQGICMVGGEDLKIVGAYSNYFEEMTGSKNLEGQSFLKLILKDTNLSKSQCQQIEQTLINSLNQESFAFEVNRHLLVKEFSRKTKCGKLEVYEIDWNTIEDDKGLIVRFLITIRNVTQLRSLEKEAMRNQEEWVAIQDILQIPAQKLPEILQNMASMLDEVFDIIKANPGLESYSRPLAAAEMNSDQLEHEFLIFRLLHTMKGNAFSFGMNTLGSMLHEVENDWSPRRRKLMEVGEDSNSTSRKSGLLNVKEKLIQYQTIMEEKLHQGKSASENGIFVPWSLLRSMVYKVKDLLNHKAIPENSEPSQELPGLLQNIVNLSFQSIEQLANEIIQSLRIKISTLQKEVPMIKVNDHGILFDPIEHQFLLSILTQLIRNSIGHGLEERNQRQQKNKPIQGCIHIDVSFHPGTRLVRITYEDDGQGYNIAALKRKGIQNSLIAENELDQQEILNLVFQPTLSTQDQATDLAGRGIGLDAVRYLLRKRGGDIHIRPLHEVGSGFTHCQLELQFQAEVWSPEAYLSAS